MAKLSATKYLSFLIVIPAICFSEIDWRGHNRFIGTSYHGIGREHSYEFSQGQLVLNHRSDFIYSSEKHQFEAAYELFATENKNIPADPNSDFKYRIKDLNYSLVKSDQDFLVIQNLDRFYYTYFGDKFELNLGRQAVGFGSARTINPLDILVPFDFLMINIEQKLGVDAIRTKIPFKQTGMVEFGISASEDVPFEDEYRFISFLQNDIRFLYQELNQHKVWGLDIQKSLLGWGTWLELGHFDIHEGENFLRYSVGGQYQFPNELSFFVEYHQNGSRVLHRDLGIFVTNRDYLNWGLDYQVTPLNKVALSSFNSLNDPSSLLNLNYELNFEENWYFDCSLYYGVGNKNASEFGSYPEIVSFNLKNFF